MHHLHEVARAARTDVAAAGVVPHVGGDGGEEGGDQGIGLPVSAGHERRAVPGTLLPAGDARAEKADAQGGAALLPALGVGVVGVAPVDDHVSRLQMGQQAVQHQVDGPARLYHNEDFPGALQTGAQGLVAFTAGHGKALRPAGLHKGLGEFRLQVVAGHGEAVLGQIQGQSAPHDRKAYHAKLR